MKFSRLRSAWIWAWLWFAILAGFGTYVSRFIAFDPFLAERYLSIFICIPFVAVLALRHGLVIRKSDLAILMASVPTISVALSSDLTYLAPLGFFTFILLLLFSNQRLSPNLALTHVVRVRLVFTGILALLSVQWLMGAAASFQLGNRFVGFFSSPTTLSTWITSLLVVSYGYSEERSPRARIIYALMIVVSAFLIFASGTRTNLIFIALLVLSEGIRPLLSNRTIRFALIILAAVAVGFIYPVYGWLIQNLPEGLVFYRYGGGDDASAGLRIALFDSVFASYLDSGLLNMLFGHGAGSSRVVVQLAFGSDLLPHNDIVRLLHDFGLVISVLFITGVATIGSRTYVSTVLTLLYVTSFLHNMVYSHYLAALIIITATRINQSSNHEVKSVGSLS